MSSPNQLRVQFRAITDACQDEFGDSDYDENHWTNSSSAEAPELFAFSLSMLCPRLIPA